MAILLHPQGLLLGKARLLQQDRQRPAHLDLRRLQHAQHNRQYFQTPKTVTLLILSPNHQKNGNRLKWPYPCKLYTKLDIISIVEMIIDEVVWNVIKNKHCSFRMKSDSQNFCRNQYNLTGLCNRKSCPLANSQYATVREEKGVCYLYMKTAERAHLPDQLWEKVRLNKSYQTALEEIDQHLIYWSPFIIHKCKQRLTKLRQMIIQMRKLKLQGKEEIVPIKKKAERRDKVREAKALISANIEQKIEEELMERLKTGVYKDIYNYNPKAFNKLMGRIEQQAEQESMQEEQFIPEQEEEEEQMIANQHEDLQF